MNKCNMCEDCTFSYAPQKFILMNFFALPLFGELQATSAGVTRFTARMDKYYFVKLVTTDTDTAPVTLGVSSLQ